MIKIINWCFCAIIVGVVGAASATEINIKAVMSPKEQMKLDFADGSQHFLLMVRREGKAEGSGPLAGASVTEFGWHDIIPGVNGDPRGYLVFSESKENTVYVKWRVRAIFVPGADGKPKLLDNGYWEIAGGTGKFAGMRGAGTLHIKAVSPSDREFTLTGEMSGKP